MKVDQTILVWDTETTGLSPEEGDAVVEVAAVPVRLSEGAWTVGQGVSYLVDPGRPIPPEASAVHHLTDDMCEDMPTLEEAVEGCRFALSEPKMTDDGGIIYPSPPGWPDFGAAHNAKFDAGFLTELRVRPLVCTYRCALHIWPGAPGYGNQTLRYWKKVVLSHHLSEDTIHYPRAVSPHSALYDAYTTAGLLQIMLQDHTPEELVALTAAPVTLTKVRFGKHSGEAWAALPTDYLRWMQRQSGWDEDVAHTLRVELERRGARL